MSWTLIESQTLGSSQASVTLGSGGTLPQTYKTLKVVMSTRSDQSGNWITVFIRPNGSSSNGSYRDVYGTGTAAGSQVDASNVDTYTVGSSSTSGTFASTTIDLPNYSASTNKPISTDSVTENNGTAALQLMSAGLWSNTAAITSIQLTFATGNFVSGSSFTLYGLK